MKWKKKFEDDWKEEGIRIKKSIEALYDKLEQAEQGKGAPQAVRGLISSSKTCMHLMHNYRGPGKTWIQARLVNLSTNLNGGAGR